MLFQGTEEQILVYDFRCGVITEQEAYLDDLTFFPLPSDFPNHDDANESRFLLADVAKFSKSSRSNILLRIQWWAFTEIACGLVLSPGIIANSTAHSEAQWIAESRLEEMLHQLDSHQN